MENFPVHPMVALFIALPLENNCVDTEIYTRKPDRNAFIRSIPVRFRDDKFRAPGLPHGMTGRRVFLYLFSQFYKDRNFVLEQSFDKKPFIETFGYDVPRFRKKHPIRLAFYKVMYSEVKFYDDRDNAKAGYSSVTQDGASMFDAVWQNGIWTVKLNSEFIFKMAFPVDFSHVIGTNKKCLFWNVYLFLVDVLPRIPKGKSKHISWELMHDVFHRRYDTIANFKYFFTQQLEDIFSIYPQAKNKVDVSDSNDLILKYAPAPI